MNETWPIALGLFASVALYAFQKWQDRIERIRERNFDVYVQMVDAICALANAHNRMGEGIDAALSNYATVKMRFAIVASDQAMKSLVAFDEKITSGNNVPHEVFDHRLADLIRSLRMENIGSASRALSNDQLIAVTPFGRSLPRRN